MIPVAADSAVDTAAIWAALARDLRSYLRRRVGDDAAEDLLQEVFVRVQAHRSDLRDEERVGAWVFQIARRVVVDHYRGRRPVDPVDGGAVEAPPDDDPDESPEAVLGLWLSHMIRTLPPIYREALELTELRGMSQRDAAETLGIPYSSLKARVQRGRARLEKLLRRCCEVELDRTGRVVDYRSRGAGSCCP